MLMKTFENQHRQENTMQLRFELLIITLRIIKDKLRIEKSHDYQSY